MVRLLRAHMWVLQAKDAAMAVKRKLIAQNSKEVKTNVS